MRSALFPVLERPFSEQMACSWAFDGLSKAVMSCSTSASVCDRGSIALGRGPEGCAGWQPLWQVRCERRCQRAKLTARPDENLSEPAILEDTSGRSGALAPQLSVASSSSPAESPAAKRQVASPMHPSSFASSLPGFRSKILGYLEEAAVPLDVTCYRWFSGPVVDARRNIMAEKRYCLELGRGPRAGKCR